MAFVMFAVACANSPSPIGPPTIWLRETWFPSEIETALVSWKPSSHCTEQFICDPPPWNALQVDSVSCDGCTVVDDAHGAISGGTISIKASANSDAETVALHVRATYLPTDLSADLVGETLVDRETGLDVKCVVINAAVLRHYVKSLQSIPTPRSNDNGFMLLRPCQATRLASDAVLLFPVVTTMRGSKIFPFREDGSTDLATVPNPNVRSLSTLEVSEVPDGWWNADGERPKFAYYANPASARISLRTSLSPSHEVATVTVDIPPAL